MNQADIRVSSCDAPNSDVPQSCCVTAGARELLLCGSGTLAYAHIGVLKALEADRVAIDVVTGTSTGALIAALYANGVSSSVIQDLFLERAPERFNPAPWLGSKTGCPSAEKMFCPIVDLEPAARAFVSEFGLKPNESLRIVCWDIIGKKTVVCSGNEYDLAIALAAACAVPGVSRPVRIGKTLLVDVATQNWQPECHCSANAIVSNAVFARDEETAVPQVGGMADVDKWLKQRRQLLRMSELSTTKCAGRLVIETKLRATTDGCACKDLTAAREAVVQEGFRSARSKLAY